MKTEAEQRTDDLAYIKEHMQIDVKHTSREEAAAILRQHEINTTSWVLSRLENEYGTKWAESYRNKVRKTSCDHGFLGSCPYCKYGTD